MANYAIITDLNRCTGCLACTVACKAVNGVPVGDFWIKTLRVGPHPKTDGAQFPDVEMYFLPVQCQHCENPSCVSVCPTGATYKREDGIVTVDDSRCIGCRSCIMACPYDGIRTMIETEPEYYLDVVVGEADAPKHVAGTVEKCTFCSNLIERGEVPACMQLCPGRARYWGDLDDPDSEVSKAIEGRDYMKLRKDAGTNPSVFYLR